MCFSGVKWIIVGRIGEANWWNETGGAKWVAEWSWLSLVLFISDGHFKVFRGSETREKVMCFAV